MHTTRQYDDIDATNKTTDEAPLETKQPGFKSCGWGTKLTISEQLVGENIVW